MNLVTQSNLTCPECGFVENVKMLADACQFFHTCVNCGRVLKPRAGHCCVFCSFGDVPCPPKQLERHEAGYHSGD